MPQPANPERSVGFLIVDLTLLLRRNFNRRASALCLTQAQWRAIAYLARDEGVKQAALAERLEIQPITLGRLIDRMEAAGWVERRTDPDDRRASRLYLTPKAQPIVAQLQDHAAETLELALAGVPAEGRKQLVSSLLQMKENLSAADGAAPSSTSKRTATHVRKSKRSTRRPAA